MRGLKQYRKAHSHLACCSRQAGMITNDNPENALALTRDAHWMFDEGLWTVDSRPASEQLVWHRTNVFAG